MAHSCQCYSTCDIVIYWSSILIFVWHQDRFWWGTMGRREHALMHKIVAHHLEFIKALVHEQHLPQCIVLVRSLPWPLDGHDVSRFGDRGTKSSRGSKFLNLMGIVC